MDAVEEHLNRALIEVYFAMAELDSAPASGIAEGEQNRALASALLMARNALETSVHLSEQAGAAGPQGGPSLRLVQS